MPRPHGLYFPDGRTFTIPQLELPDGEFLLPVCTTRDKLHRTLSILWEGRFLHPDDPANTEHPTDEHTLAHMTDILEALAYVNRPYDVPCIEIDSCDDGCIDFLPNAGIIEYFPNDPFRTPALVPPGYTRPPWYSNPAIPIGGIRPTDAMVDTLAVLAPALPLSGFPYARIHFSGVGELEIELIQVPAGGICLIDIDDDPTKITLVDCSSDIIDLVSIAGILAALGFDVEDANLVGTKVIELEIDTPGDHFVDVNFIPSLGGETLVGFGGGIRRVSLCGLTVPGEYMPYLLRSSPTDGCLVEQSNDGGLTWTEAFRMDNCCCDTEPLGQRLTDDGFLEVTLDGVTWDITIEGDTRFTNPTAPPIPSPSSTTRCQAANSLTTLFEEHQIADYNRKVAGAGFADFVAAITGFLVVAGVITGGLTVVLSLITTMIAALVASVTAAEFGGHFTAATWDSLVCIFYCNMDDDGGVSQTQFSQMQVDVMTQIGGFAGRWIKAYIQSLGTVGLTNLGRQLKAGTRDCEGCDCSTECVNEAFIFIGDFVSKTATTITIDAVLTSYYGDSRYAVYYGSELTNDFCCFFCNHTIESGVLNGGAWVDCNGSGFFNSPNGQIVRNVQYSFGASPGRITLNLGVDGCPEI